jgi:hypothetical protein
VSFRPDFAAANVIGVQDVSYAMSLAKLDLSSAFDAKR